MKRRTSLRQRMRRMRIRKILCVYLSEISISPPHSRCYLRRVCFCSYGLSDMMVEKTFFPIIIISIFNVSFHLCFIVYFIFVYSIINIKWFY